LLTAASVGYVTSLALALVAVWKMRRERPAAPREFRAPRGFVQLGVGLAAFNALLLLGAGPAWGWQNGGLGVVALGVLRGLLAARTIRHAPASICDAQGAEDEMS